MFSIYLDLKSAITISLVVTINGNVVMITAYGETTENNKIDGPLSSIAGINISPMTARNVDLEMCYRYLIDFCFGEESIIA